MTKPHIVIISPALAKANNGNWQTASRWARFLRHHYKVRILAAWDGMPCAAMIALHARRSAPSIASFHAACPDRPLVVVLTGTDLYRDIKHDAAAQQSLQLATRLVVLQEAGPEELTPALRGKTEVIHQSCLVLKPAPRSIRRFDVVMIGHLREEKDPLTFMDAARRLQMPHVRLTQIGAALDPALGAQAQATQAATPRYRWLDALPHAQTRQCLKRSHLLVLTSRMEGGANVIIEALNSGVPVLASSISGNRGMLGPDYAGYFPVGDAAALARLIERCAAEPAYHAQLQAQCAVRSVLFTPEREQAALQQLLDNLLSSRR